MPLNHFSVLISPTFRCNADCEYCFENKTSDVMELEDFDLITAENRHVPTAPGSHGVEASLDRRRNPHHVPGVAPQGERHVPGNQPKRARLASRTRSSPT